MSAKALFLVVVVLVLATQAASALATAPWAGDATTAQATGWAAPASGPFVLGQHGLELDGELECGGNGTCPT
jgi:hypothetical protein